MMEKITDPFRWFLGRLNRDGRGMRCVRCVCVCVCVSGRHEAQQQDVQSVSEKA